jgi:hypothetical protein
MGSLVVTVIIFAQPPSPEKISTAINNAPDKRVVAAVIGAVSALHMRMTAGIKAPTSIKSPRTVVGR